MRTALALRRKDARARRPARKKARRGSQGWLKNVLMIVVVVTEWLLIAADVLTRIYLVG